MSIIPPPIDRFALDLPTRCWKNFKPSNTRKLRRMFSNVRNGVSNGVLCMCGDSTTAGAGAGGGTFGYTGAKVAAAPRRMAEILNRSVLPAQEVGFFGNNNSPGDPALYDARLLLGSGWAAVNLGPGGAYFLNTTTTSSFSFTPTAPFDTIAYWYGQGPSYATFTVDIDGGAALETVNAAGGGAMLKRTLTVSLGTHTINWKRVSGTSALITGCTVYNSTLPKVVDVYNCGIAGAAVANLNTSANPWDPKNAYVVLAADVYVIDIGINDWVAGTSLSAFTASYQSLIDALKAVGDVIMVNPLPRAVANTPLATQLQYYTAITALATKNDLPLIDLRLYFETQEISNTLGLYFDITHPNNIGYAAKADVLASALTSV